VRKAWAVIAVAAMVSWLRELHWVPVSTLGGADRSGRSRPVAVSVNTPTSNRLSPSLSAPRVQTLLGTVAVIWIGPAESEGPTVWAWAATTRTRKAGGASRKDRARCMAQLPEAVRPASGPRVMVTRAR
jgi:hypothetical protein